MLNTLMTLFVVFSLFSITLACFSPSMPTVLMLSFVCLMYLTPADLLPSLILLVLWLLFFLYFAIRLFPNMRKTYLSKPIYQHVNRVIPTFSAIEQEAIRAGTTGWEADMLSGAPEWHALFNAPKRSLTAEEKLFLDETVNAYLALGTPWESHERQDLSPEQWIFLKQERFFALTLPTEYGGLGFSNDAFAAIINKVASHCMASGITIMVPNVLGLTTLLTEYGTNEQKETFLPRLASGEDLPCFALTSPWAGADAGAIPDTGVICTRQIDGEEVLGFSLNIDKRYVSLAPVATQVGLAFNAFDPEGLLGDHDQLGLTCVIMPADTEGLDIGNRHNPLGLPFQNGTIRGKNVFVPLTSVIGGKDNIGKGWQMLLTCHAVGRGLALPNLSNAAGKKCSLVTGAYAKVRKQFGMSMGNLEGVSEPLSQIAMNTYAVDAACLLLNDSLRQGNKPAVLSSMLKYFGSERARASLVHAMNVHAGKAVMIGPNNYLADSYALCTIGVKFEDNNILIRSKDIFERGLICSHPYIKMELAACANPDKEEGLAEFDALLVSHLGYLLTNKARAFVFGLSGGRLAPKTGLDLPKKLERKAQKAQQISAALAYICDVSLGFLGKDLKRKELLSGNIAEAWVSITMLSACLKKWVDEGRNEADILLVAATCDELLATADQTLDSALANYPSPVLGTVMRWVSRPLGSKCRGASDKDKIALAGLLTNENDAQKRLTSTVFVSENKDNPVTVLLDAHQHFSTYQDTLRKLKKAGYGTLTLPIEAILETVIKKDILTEAEADRFLSIHKKIKRVIDVDEFATA